VTVTRVFIFSALLACFASPLLAGAQSLAIDGPGQQKTITVRALQAMPHIPLTVTDNHIHKKETYQGVPLILLMQQVGGPKAADVKGKALSEYVVATGSDGYRVVLSLAEIEPAFHSGTILVADEVDGKPLDAKSGPFKLVVSEDVQPARWVHNLVRLDLKTAP
jgi:hypothetical protein